MHYKKNRQNWKQHMTNKTIYFCLLSALLTGFASAKEPPASLTYSYKRSDYNFAIIPFAVINNTGAAEENLRVVSSLTDTQGKVIRRGEYAINVGAGKSVEVDLFPDYKDKQVHDTYLLTTEIYRGNTQIHSLSDFVGVAKPVDSGAVDVFGMNVHLRRYTPDIQWKLLSMLREAGISTVRLDFNFAMPDMDEEVFNKAVEKLERVILGVEAFGIEPMVLIGYFPKGFHQSPDKLKNAYDWAKRVAARFKGRVSWHYGNETNVGWGAFGAAADMAELNNAFSLGTLAGDPGALKGSFGIAEGFPAYIEEMLKSHAGEYLDAIAIHPYCGTPEAGIAKCLAAKKLIRKYGGQQQVWATEVGFHVDKEQGELNPFTKEHTLVMGYSLQQQAELLVRLYVLAASHQIERVYWYDFFGLRDRETFWMVDENFNPRPAYKSLSLCTSFLKGAVPLGGTDPSDLVQLHYFQKEDGTVFAVCWALKKELKSGLNLPTNVKATDANGNPFDLSTGVLGQCPVFIENLPQTLVNGFIRKDIMLSTIDKRTFSRPHHRFEINAGEKVRIPCTIFNTSKNNVFVRPRIYGGCPGWKTELPARSQVEAGSSVGNYITLTSPENGVPGTEYRFVFYADVDDLQRTLPTEIRVRLKGGFPYQDIIDYHRIVDYPMWNSMDETIMDTGREVLEASSDQAVIDGDLHEWKADEFYALDQQFQWRHRDTGQPDRKDWSGKVAFRWDESYLYVACLVQDDDLSLIDYVSRDWRDNDNLRIFISGEPDKSKRAKKISERELLLIFSPTDIERSSGPVFMAAALGGYLREGMNEKITSASFVWYNGYTLEVKIPLAEVGMKPGSGILLGLNVMADDADEGFRQHVSMTRYINALYWNSPRSLGILKLSGE
jgi:hypothetical protein